MSGIGKMQRFHALIQSLSFCIGGILVFNYPLLELYPHYKCRFMDQKEFTPCKLRDICWPSPESQVVDKWKVDYSFPDTLDNWIIDLDLHCATRF